MTTLAFTMKNDETGKWELVINQKVFRKTAGEEVHLLPGLENYKNFSELGVNEIVLVNGTVFKIGGDTTNGHKLPKKIKFDVNQRYDFMEKIITMITRNKIESSIITGSPGLGKTYTVMSRLKAEGLHIKNDDFAIVKGYSTPKGLYRTLYENQDKIIVFDDCDSILKDPTARNLLKGALDSYEKRTITWNSESPVEDLPKSFDFNGRVIFISNMTLKKFDQALISRSMVIDLSMNDNDVIERMKHVLYNVMPNVSMEKKEMAIEFIIKHLDRIGDLNFRTLIKVVKIIDSFEENWENLALYAIQH